MEFTLTSLNAVAQDWAGVLWPILYQSAILAGVVYLITRFRRVPAAWRFWLWMLIPLRLLLMPVLTISLPMLPAAVLHGPAQQSIVMHNAGTIPSISESGPVDERESSVTVGIEETASSDLTVVAAVGPSTWTVLLAFWVLGVLISAGRLARGWLGVRGIIADARPETDRLVLEIAGKAAAGIDLKARPTLLRTEAKISPFVYGVFRPVVVLPQALVTSLLAEQIRAVLTHEFAHLRRRDALSGWVMAICQVVYFFHPVFYIARHSLMLEREAACDECVLAHGRTRRSLYIESLIDAADVFRDVHARVAPLAVVAESFTHLRRRLMLLTHRPDPIAPPSSFAFALLLVFSLLAIPGLAITKRSAGTAANDAAAPESGRALTVEVIDGDGSPVEFAGVEVIANHRPIASGLTDEDGRATLTLPQDAIVQWVIAVRSGIGFDYYECFPSPDSGTVGLPGAPARDLPPEIELVLAGAREIRIHAVDSEDKPIRNARFAPWRITMKHKRFPVSLSGSTLAAVETDANGAAIFDWIPRETWNDPGSTFLVLGRNYHWPDAPEDVFPGEDDVDVSARLLRNGTISGMATLPDGSPAANMLVVAEGRGDTVQFCRTSTRTAADGTYQLDVYPDQTYIVSVIDETWAGSRLGIDVGSDEPAADVDLALTEGALIHGRMTWEDSDDTPVAGELILLLFEDAELPQRIERSMLTGYWKLNFENVVHHRAAITDADGRYSFRVGPGDYAICGNGSLTGNNVHRPTKINVPSDAMKELRFDMQKAKGTDVLGTSAAPIRVRGSELIEYAFHPAWKNTQDVGCRQCHQPNREEPSVHGGGSR